MSGKEIFGKTIDSEVENYKKIINTAVKYSSYCINNPEIIYVPVAEKINSNNNTYNDEIRKEILLGVRNHIYLQWIFSTYFEYVDALSGTDLVDGEVPIPEFASALLTENKINIEGFDISLVEKSSVVDEYKAYYDNEKMKKVNKELKLIRDPNEPIPKTEVLKVINKDDDDDDEGFCTDIEEYDEDDDDDDDDDDNSETTAKGKKHKLTLKQYSSCFDLKDDYYIGDFIMWMKSKNFKPEEDMNTLIKTNLSRVFRVIIGGKKQYIVKESKEVPYVVVNNRSFKNDYSKESYKVTRVKKLKGGKTKKEVSQHNINDTFDRYSELYCSQITCVPFHNDSPLKTEYNGTVPKFNIFPGFKATYIGKVKTGDENYNKIKPLLNHIFEVWCDSNAELYKYIMSYMAHPIRFLCSAKVSVSLKGSKGGEGKNTPLEFFTDFVYGPQLSCIFDKLEEVMDKFNSMLAGKLFVIANESSSSDRKEYNKCFEKFKSQIDSPVLNIERKGQDKYSIPNILTYCSVSNNDSIKLDSGSDNRKYVMLEVNKKYANNIPYFTDLRNKVFNQECGDIMYSYLRDGDLEIVPLMPAFVTDYKNIMTDATMSKLDQFFNEVFTERSIPLSGDLFHFDNKLKMYFFSRTALFSEYAKFANIESKSDKGFTLKLHNLIKEGILLSTKTDGDRKIIPAGRLVCSCLHPKYYWGTSINQLTTVQRGMHLTQEYHITSLDVLYTQEMLLIEPNFKYPEEYKTIKFE